MIAQRERRIMQMQELSIRIQAVCHTIIPLPLYLENIYQYTLFRFIIKLKPLVQSKIVYLQLLSIANWIYQLVLVFISMVCTNAI